jgi:phosphatidylglycerophosphatase A
MTAISLSWTSLILGFGLFRLFDILKPWPASYFDRKVANGFGVVMDDIMAGCYTLSILHILKFFQLV